MVSRLESGFRAVLSSNKFIASVSTRCCATPAGRGIADGRRGLWVALRSTWRTARDNSSWYETASNRDSSTIATDSEQCQTRFRAAKAKFINASQRTGGALLQIRVGNRLPRCVRLGGQEAIRFVLAASANLPPWTISGLPGATRLLPARISSRAAFFATPRNRTTKTPASFTGERIATSF